MKVLGINASARKDGNTAMLLKTVFEELLKDEEGIANMKNLGQNMAFLLKALKQEGTI